MIKNLFLNTSAIRYAPDNEGNKTAAELERESISVEEIKPKEEKEDDKSDSDNEDDKSDKPLEDEANEEETEKEEIAEETAEERTIREADEAAEADTKTKRQIERMQKRIDTLTAQKRTTDTEKAELQKLLDAKQADGTLTLTEEEVERRAELKAQAINDTRQFQKAVDTLAKGANALDKDFSKNIKIVTDEIALLPPVMIGILEDLENEAGKNVGAEVLVYLSKNIDAYEDIYSLSEGRMALKLQNLANKISKKPAKPVSQVPAPNRPVGGNNVQSPLNDKMTDDEWIAKRNAEVAAKRRA